jgi:hypothetical protein
MNDKNSGACLRLQGWLTDFLDGGGVLPPVQTPRTETSACAQMAMALL